MNIGKGVYILFQYPLNFTFRYFPFFPKITVKDKSGEIVFVAKKKIFASKEEVYLTKNEKILYSIISQESQITEIPSNWDIRDGNGNILATIKDDFLSTIDTSKIFPKGASIFIDMEIQRSLNLRSIKMYRINSIDGKHIGLVTPDPKTLVALQLPLDRLIKKIPGFFYRFITPSYYIRFGEETKMVLKKERTLFIDTYKMEEQGLFNNSEEAILLNSVVLSLLYERDSLKFMYT